MEKQTIGGEFDIYPFEWIDGPHPWDDIDVWPPGGWPKVP